MDYELEAERIEMERTWYWLLYVVAMVAILLVVTPLLLVEWVVKGVLRMADGFTEGINGRLNRMERRWWG